MNNPDVPAIADQFAIDLEETLVEIKNMLLEKNRKYGDAALNPKRIFSRAGVQEQIKVRLDDKISRLANQQTDEDEDPATDMLGYLILLKIAAKRENKRTATTVQTVPRPMTSEEWEREYPNTQFPRSC